MPVAGGDGEARTWPPAPATPATRSAAALARRSARIAITTMGARLRCHASCSSSMAMMAVAWPRSLSRRRLRHTCTHHIACNPCAHPPPPALPPRPPPACMHAHQRPRLDGDVVLHIRAGPRSQQHLRCKPGHVQGGIVQRGAAAAASTVQRGARVQQSTSRERSVMLGCPHQWRHPVERVRLVHAGPCRQQHLDGFHAVRRGSSTQRGARAGAATPAPPAWMVTSGQSLADCFGVAAHARDDQAVVIRIHGWGERERGGGSDNAAANRRRHTGVAQTAPRARAAHTPNCTTSSLHQRKRQPPACPTPSSNTNDLVPHGINAHVAHAPTQPPTCASDCDPRRPRSAWCPANLRHLRPAAPRRAPTDVRAVVAHHTPGDARLVGGENALAAACSRHPPRLTPQRRRSSSRRISAPAGGRCVSRSERCACVACGKRGQRAAVGRSDHPGRPGIC
jgi:hypothetical protein